MDMYVFGVIETLSITTRQKRGISILFTVTISTPTLWKKISVCQEEYRMGIMNDVIEERLRTPVSADVDVVVAGAGPAGIGAAIGAAQAGAKVYLVDKNGCTGGMLTTGHVLNVRQNGNGERIIIAGCVAAYAKRLQRNGAMRDNPGDAPMFTQDPEISKLELQAMLDEAGVICRYGTWVVNTLMEKGAVSGVIIENKAGRTALRARVTVDATGDGDVIFHSGAEYVQRGPGEVQPMTLAFALANVDDWPNSFYTPQNMQKVKEAKEKGIYPSPVGPAVFPMPRRGFMYVNGTRVPGNATDPADLTRAGTLARKQAFGVAAWLRENIPGYQNCVISCSAETIGLRESRRLKGVYTLTREDVLSFRNFPDNIALGAYAIDVHNPHGSGGEMTRLKPGHHYGIPYRVLLPQNMDGLLAAGRCISADVSALGSVRVMATCMATGQAAGAAAALAVKAEILPRALNPEVLRTELTRQGAIIE
jgi:ribulose 1,5-bisphosphate synthetase/thiazole synthase